MKLLRLCLSVLPFVLLTGAARPTPHAAPAPPPPAYLDRSAANSIPDGLGGVISAWTERRGDRGDVLVQRALVSGRNDPDWPVDGVTVSRVHGGQLAPSLTSDGL